jgi:glycine/D-amino acid oxidase-like deaminating enzyme
MGRDVVVVGGGIIGCSIALRLAQAGLKVTVIERGRIGREASWAAAGMISPQTEASGPGPFRLCLEAVDLSGVQAAEVTELVLTSNTGTRVPFVFSSLKTARATRTMDKLADQRGASDRVVASRHSAPAGTGGHESAAGAVFCAPRSPSRKPAINAGLEPRSGGSGAR